MLGLIDWSLLPVQLFHDFCHFSDISSVMRGSSSEAGDFSAVAERERCTSGCVVECRNCNREVASSNLGLGYFAPRSTQPFIPVGSVNEYQLRLGRQRQVWLIPIADERVGVHLKLWNPLRICAIPERFCGGDSLQRGTISSVCIGLLISRNIDMTWNPTLSDGFSLLCLNWVFFN